MSERPRGNLLALAGTRAVLAVSGLVVNITLARWLTLEAFGDVQWLLALTAVAHVGSTLGLGAWLTREVAKDRPAQRHLTLRALATAGVSAAATAVLIVGYAWVMHPDPRLALAAAFAAGTLALNGSAQIMQGGFQGLRRMKLELPAIVSGRSALVLTQVGLATAGFGVVALFAGRLAAAVVLVAVLLATQWWRIGPLQGPVRWSEVTALSRTGRAFAATVLFGAIYAQADTLMLQAMVGSVEVARYRAPAAVLLQLAFVGTIVTRGVFPRLAAAQGDAARVSSELVFQTRVLLLLGLPIAAGGAVLAAPLITAVFGPTYADTAPIFAVLLWAVPVRFVVHGYGYGLTALGQESVRWRVDAAAAALNVVLNLAVIGTYGAQGAALTTLVTDLALWVVLRRLIRAHVGEVGLGEAPAVARVALAALAMAAAVWALPGVNVWARVAVGVVVFVPAAWLTGAWSRADLGRLRRV